MSLGISGIGASPIGSPLGPTIESSEMSFGAFELVSRVTVSGAAVVDVDFTGLDLEAVNEYMLRLYLRNSSGAIRKHALEFNGDTTATNYYTQGLQADHNTISGSRANNNEIISIANNINAMCIIQIRKMASQIPYAFVIMPSQPANAVQLYNKSLAWVTTNNVTQITLAGNGADAIAIGSIIELWKMSA